MVQHLFFQLVSSFKNGPFGLETACFNSTLRCRIRELLAESLSVAARESYWNLAVRALHELLVDFVVPHQLAAPRRDPWQLLRGNSGAFRKLLGTS